MRSPNVPTDSPPGGAPCSVSGSKPIGVGRLQRACDVERCFAVANQDDRHRSGEDSRARQADRAAWRIIERASSILSPPCRLPPPARCPPSELLAPAPAGGDARRRARRRRRHRSAAAAPCRTRRPEQRRVGVPGRRRRCERSRGARACCSGLDDSARARRWACRTAGLRTAWPRCANVSRKRACCMPAMPARGRGRLVTLDDAAERIGAWRAPLHRGERTLAELCRAAGLTLALDRLVYFSHWLTPLGRTKRFDTRFFIAAAPAGADRCARRREVVEQRWLKPADALAQGVELRLMTPTQETLRGGRALRQRARAAAPLPRAPRDVPLVMPRLGVRQPRPAAGDARRAGMGRDRPHRPGRAGHASLRHPARHRGAPVGAHDPRHGEQRQRDDRPRHQQLPGRRRRAQRMGGHRPRSARSGAPAGIARGRARSDPPDLRDAHAQRPFARHGARCRPHTGAAVHGRVAAYPEWQDTSFAPTDRCKVASASALDDRRRCA